MIYSILPLILIIGLLLLKKVNVKIIINGLFWGIISVLLTSVIDLTILPLFGFSSNIISLVSGVVGVSAFVIYFFVAALPEEGSKFMSIKFGSKKEKDSIFINSILVGLTFACMENLIYISSYGSYLVLTRMLQPGHLFFQLVMAFLLVKALNCVGFKKILFIILSLVLPMLCHTIFNTFNSIDIVSYIFYALGILTYVFTFCLILKLPVNTEQYKLKLGWLKIVIVILSILLLMIISSQKTSYSLNEMAKIEEDNIELKVISSEKVEIDDYFFSGNYIKVKVELKNNSDTSYFISTIDYKLVDNVNNNDSYLSFGVFDDRLVEVAAGETGVGYLYFDDEGHNYTYLVYSTGEYDNTQTYSFNLK